MGALKRTLGLSVASLLICACLMACSICALASSPQWPMDRADARHSGVSPVDAVIDPLQVVWMHPVGYAISVVIGGDGIVYLKDEYHIQAIDSNGSELWTMPLGWGDLAMADDGTMRVFTSSTIKSIGADGTVLWSITVPGLNSALSSPVIDANGTVYGAFDNRSSPDLASGIIAVDSGGTTLWTFESVGVPGLSIAIANDGTILFTTSIYDGPSYLYAINPNGTMKWRVETTSGWMEGKLAVGGDGSVYLTNGNSMHVFGADGSAKWSCGRSERYPPPCIGGDRIIVTSGHNVSCLDPNGNEIWTYNSQDIVNDQLLMKNGSLMLVTQSNVTFLDSNGVQITSAQIFNLGNYERSLWYPVIDSVGTIYLIFYGQGIYLVKLGVAPVHPELAARE